MMAAEEGWDWQPAEQQLAEVLGRPPMITQQHDGCGSKLTCCKYNPCPAASILEAWEYACSRWACVYRLYTCCQPLSVEPYLLHLLTCLCIWCDTVLVWLTTAGWLGVSSPNAGATLPTLWTTH